ncbi:MAG: type IV conjugative transfer system protein TraE [Gammaproteobacteria bacterium]|nr:type IV conjugative transfer system protein TraE [Gammaproteobacteria bacterium]MDH5651250.1 type IV conjugative transfer system protein TraE [Gammaproteobacteria bacterium]
MNLQRFRSRLMAAQFNGKLWFVMAVTMAMSNLLLTSHVITNDSREKTILVPPKLEQPFWIHGNEASPEYLIQVGEWFAGLLLSYTPKNLDYRIQTFLRYASPGAYSVLQTQLFDEAKRIKQHEMSAMFFPTDARVRGEYVAIFGQQVIRVGKEIVSEKTIAYRLKFQFQSGFVHVTEFKEVQHDKPFVIHHATDPAR